jgi:hypothetical protein
MTFLEFKKTHLIINPNYFTAADLYGVFDIDISKNLYNEIIILKKTYYKRDLMLTSVVINIKMIKIVYYWCGHDNLYNIDSYLDNFKTNNFNLFYNINMRIPIENLISLYSVADVIICFEYKSTKKSKKSDGSFFYKNIYYYSGNNIYTTVAETRKREYKLEKLLESIE